MAAGHLADQFSSLWKDDNPPDVVTFLSAHPEAEARECVDILLIDQYRRWRSGCPIPTEDYLAAHAQLAEHEDLQLELIVEEFGYLEERDGSIDRQAFFARFQNLSPTVREKLETILPGSSNGNGSSQLTSRFKSADDPPKQLDRYQIVREIGRGTFGIVYLATDSELQRDVAIKVPSRRQIDRAGGADTFLREARAVAALDHSGIVPVYDVGTLDNGDCYVVSKYIEGEHLGRRLKVASFSHHDAVNIVAHLARALHSAHLNGIVHRDIKPANILVDADDSPHLVDFGLALKDEDFGQGAALVGTPAYMSPEQARGEGHRVDARSDVYSLGVVLYEMLTGQRPHRGKTTTAMLAQVCRSEVRPPRQVDETIPRELDRICLKALSRRVSDRYATAGEFADELDAYIAEITSATSSITIGPAPSPATQLIEGGTDKTISVNTTAPSGSVGQLTSDADLKIVPRGLRAFGADDAEFFRELLPGPRDRTGMPDSVRFWRARLDEMEPEETFAVGLIYGPSGCGKSSLVRAGVIPSLGEHVVVVYLEATATDTESRLLSALRRQCPRLPDDKGLVESVAALRRPGVLEAGKKVVIVLDQFEQWLHDWHEAENADLTRGLLQCDGAHVQAVVMVRDDFWMSATRFMRELEIPLIEGHNAAAVDLFDIRHARRVLSAYGRAFGALAEHDRELTRANTAFIHNAVDGLAVDGKVICVRLALFAEMVKHKPWIPATFQQLGGAHGVGETFLDENFGAAAPPRFRAHARAVKSLLEALIPPTGSNIKATARSVADLRAASGYADDIAAFDELLRILNFELRLITPAHLDNVETDAKPTAKSNHPHVASQSPPHAQRYQLTHDYLVPAIRNWLTRSQRRTLRGRAALQLRELADEWSNRPDRRYLPTVVEFLGIRLLTNAQTWNGVQRQMMASAAKLYVKRALFVLAAIVAAVWVGSETYGRFQAEALVSRMMDASLAEVPDVLDEATPYRRWLTPKLHQRLAEELASSTADNKSRQELALRLALLPDDQNQAVQLLDPLLTTRPPQFVTIRDALHPHRSLLTDQLWEALANPPPRTHNPRLQAAAALATFDPNNTRWTELATVATDELVSVRPVYLDAWLDQLEPISQRLIEPLTEVFHNTGREDVQRDAAAEALARYAADDPERLFKLSLVARGRQFIALSPELAAHRDPAIEYFRFQLNRDPWDWQHPDHKSEWSELSDSVREQIESDYGLLTDTFAMVTQMSFDDEFDAVTAALGRSGYRPTRIRPYHTSAGPKVAATWYRDGGQFQFEQGFDAAELHARHATLNRQSFLAVDVAGYLKDDREQYCALWHKMPSGPTATTSLAIGLTGDEFEKLVDRLVDDSRIPVARQMFHSKTGELLHSLVLRRKKGEDFRWETLAGDKNFYYDKRGLTRRQVDVSICRDPAHHAEMPKALVAGLWFRGDESKRTAAIMPNGGPIHLKSSRQYSEMKPEYIPIGIGASELRQGGEIWITSVWERPFISWRGKAEDSRQKSNAAIALLLLGQSDSIFELLAMRPDPTLRSNIIDRLASLNVPADMILSQLDKVHTPSIRRGLLLALVEYADKSLAPVTRTEIVDKATRLYRSDADAGIHAAAELLLKRYDEDLPAEEFDDRQMAAHGSHHAGWFIGPNGHSLSTLTAGEFSMGFRPNDEYRNSAAQQHTRRINRRFAIANKETTVEQFSRFLETRPQLKEREGEGLTRRGGPQINLSFYLAVEYCNWLSKLAGIPEKQWCYIPNGKGKYDVGMTIPADSLRRTGYRLPTEGEWEFACRAGSETMFYFGESTELLSKYAWHAGVSGHRAHPVGQLRPNDFGLFDMLGNGIEITHTPYFRNFVDIPNDAPFPQVIDDQVGEVTCVADMFFATRGSGFEYEYSSQTSPRRGVTYPQGRSRMMTFRVARTMPPRDE